MCCVLVGKQISVGIGISSVAYGSVLVGPLGDPAKDGTEHGEVYIPAIIKSKWFILIQYGPPGTIHGVHSAARCGVQVAKPGSVEG